MSAALTQTSSKESYVYSSWSPIPIARHNREKSREISNAGFVEAVNALKADGLLWEFVTLLDLNLDWRTYM